jgi:hypothetical protein
MTDKEIIPIKPSHGTVDFKSKAQMVQWPASDYEVVSRFYRKLNQLTIQAQLRAESAYSYFHILARDPQNKKKHNKYNQLVKIAEVSQDILSMWVNDLEYGCFRYKYSDRKRPFELWKGKVEPQKITIKENSLVNPALKIYAKQIANAGTEEFRYIASGTVSLPTTPEMNRLHNENSRLDLFVNGGYRNPHGDVVREGVVFPPALDDALIKEFGSFTAPQANAGTMQWRNFIETPSEQIEHDQGNTFYSIAHVTILEITFIE